MRLYFELPRISILHLKMKKLHVHTVHEKRLHFTCCKNSDLNPLINLFTLTGLSPSSPFFLVCFFLTCFLSILVKKIIRWITLYFESLHCQLFHVSLSEREVPHSVITVDQSLPVSFSSKNKVNCKFSLLQ